MNARYGWVVVGAGALISCVAMGSAFSLAIFLQPISADTGWSRTGVSSAATLLFVVMGFSAFGWGWLSDRWGVRPVIVAGAVLLGIGLVATSYAADLLQFQLLFGVLIGTAGGAFYAPLMTVATALVRTPSQPRGGADLGRHGDGAAPRRADRALADHGLRLAHGDAGRSASGRPPWWCRPRC